MCHHAKNLFARKSEFLFEMSLTRFSFESDDMLFLTAHRWWQSRSKHVSIRSNCALRRVTSNAVLAVDLCLQNSIKLFSSLSFFSPAFLALHFRPSFPVLHFQPPPLICNRNWVHGPGCKIYYLFPNSDNCYPFCTDCWCQCYDIKIRVFQRHASEWNRQQHKQAQN